MTIMSKKEKSTLRTMSSTFEKVFLPGLLLMSSVLACEQDKLPNAVRQICICSNSSVLNCKGVNSTVIFSVKASINDITNVEASDSFEYVQEIAIQDSPHLKCISAEHFKGFKALKALSVTQSGLKSISCDLKKEQNMSEFLFQQLETLTLSGNSLEELRREDFLHQLANLKTLNLSHNHIKYIAPSFFENFQKLVTLDLSNNKLAANINPSVFKTLPKSVQYLDISNNTWACSSQLAWMHQWKSSLKDDSILKNIIFTRCVHDDIHTSRLFLVMKYYDELVMPHCPKKDGCTCLLHSIQETLVTTVKRHYTVYVNCVRKNLTHFPILPKHTQAVDLSHNKLNDSAFSSLDVKGHHYDEVENLTLDGNNFEHLPERLLDMNLGMRFSAKNNKLTSISYDVSQKLIKTTDVLELSNNPWTCTCSSQINDLSILAKIFDRTELVCGSGSDMHLQNQKIVSIDPEILCPPSSNGESQELMLQLLCVVLAFLIVSILSKLAYDFRVYRTRGQLPWLALKMH